MDDKNTAKKAAALKAVEWVSNGMTIGLGTGSTAFYVLVQLAQRISEGLELKAVASSQHTEDMARQLGIPIIDHSSVSKLDLYIDGADEVDEKLNLIKGGGGALLREKILAANSQMFIVIVDNSKLVRTLGAFALPIEILPFGCQMTFNQLESLGGKPILRKKDEEWFITDNGNLVADCIFGSINEPAHLNDLIHEIPGVVECGIFPKNMVHKLIVGFPDNSIRVYEKGTTVSLLNE